MVVKNRNSHLESIRKLLVDQHGSLFTSDLSEYNIPRTYLSILERNGEIEKTSRGIYRSVSSLDDEMYNFQVRFKSSIYSHETALFLHDLTDRIPLSYSITIPVGYHSISLKDSGCKIFYVNRNKIHLGVISMKSPYDNSIRVTNLERTICDVLRSRNQMDVQFVNDAIKRYVVHKNRNLDQLYYFATQFRIQKKIREYIEVIL
jgi:predicted transcriptional regulator of viral defense system